MESINVHVCDLADSGSNTGRLIFRFCENKGDLEGSPAEVRNNPKCCVTNRFGWYNMEYAYWKNSWSMIDSNTKHDDGGDKLGQCEGFEIRGPKVFLSGKLILMLLNTILKTILLKFANMAAYLS